MTDSGYFRSLRFGLWALLLVCSAAFGSDEEMPYGVWKTTEYHIDGTVLPLDGLMIITPGYFIGNTTFDADGDGELDANANSGPITVEDGKIRLLQWMQLHWRSSGDGHFLKEDVPEDINYSVEDNRLIFHFPSGNKYVSVRLSHLPQ